MRSFHGWWQGMYVRSAPLATRAGKGSKHYAMGQPVRARLKPHNGGAEGQRPARGSEREKACSNG